MIRTTSMVLLAVAGLAAVAVVGSNLGAQSPKEARSEPEQSDMKMQCPMMAGLKGIELFADSPAVLQAEAKDLKLTEQQLEQLKEIEQSARRQAHELLTEEQQQQLDTRSDGPLSLMQLSMSRMKQMQDGKPDQMCPMCKKMMMKMKDGEGIIRAAEKTRSSSSSCLADPQPFNVTPEVAAERYLLGRRSAGLAVSKPIPPAGSSLARVSGIGYSTKTRS